MAKRTRILKVSAWLAGGAAGASLVLAAVGQTAAQSPTSPSTVRPQARVFDRLESAVTRPLPQAPPVVPRVPGDTLWVPDQRVMVPSVGAVHVPGHWQHRLPSGDVLVPPVVTHRAEDGTIVVLPGGRLPAPGLRQAP